MGKAKNAKKYRKRLGQTSEPVPLTTHEDDAKVNMLLANIGSIHDKKRAEACVLLANIFSKDISRAAVLDKMSSPDILSKLSMRLVDSVDMVRVHAAGAIRNMATCRNKAVSQRLVSIGLMGTVISLVLDNLDKKLEEEPEISYVDQLIACVSNICASCDEAVEEIRKREFCATLVQILATPTLHISIQRSAAQCLYTVTENQVEISQSILMLSDGEEILLNVGQQPVSADDLDRSLASLYSVGALIKIYGSVPCSNCEDLTQKMQHIAPILLNYLNPSDDTLSMCSSVTVDDELVDSKQQNKSISSQSMDTTEVALSENDIDVGMSDDHLDEDVDDVERDDEGEEVYVGGDIEKPWGPVFEAVEVAAEIIANLAVVLKEHCIGQDEDQKGDYEEVEWDDDDEAEGRMEAIATLKSAHQEELSCFKRRIELGVFDANSCIGSCVSVLSRLHTSLEIMANRSEKDNGKFLSSSYEILCASDKLLTALTNFLYLIDEWTENEVNTLMELLLNQFNTFVAILNGVTPSSSGELDNITHCNWCLSSLLSQPKVQVIIRTALASTVYCLATLHRMPMEESLLALSSPLTHRLRGTRLVSIIRGFSTIPFWEVSRHCLDVVSFLGSTELHINEVKLVSNSLLKRLSDPSALREIDGKNGKRSMIDASILVMEACISSFIDLHSSDNPEIYQVYLSLNSATLLQEAFGDFKNKIRAEASMLDKDEIQQCKETLLNLKRFIKYKADPP